MFYHIESRVSITRHETHSKVKHSITVGQMEAGTAERCSIVIQMTEDNDYSTLMPCFPRSDAEPTRHLALITSGLGSSRLDGPGSIILMVMTTRLMSTFLAPTICLHQLLPGTTGFIVPTNCLYY